MDYVDRVVRDEMGNYDSSGKGFLFAADVLHENYLDYLVASVLAAEVIVKKDLWWRRRNRSP